MGRDASKCKICATFAPLRAVKLLKVLLPNGGRMYAPVPDPNLPGHFKSFEQLKTDLMLGTSPSKPDFYLPTLKDCYSSYVCPLFDNLNAADSCNFVCTSNTEFVRHISVFHPSVKVADVIEYRCKFKLSNGIICNRLFDKKKELEYHKQIQMHKNPRKRKNANADNQAESTDLNPAAKKSRNNRLVISLSFFVYI